MQYTDVVAIDPSTACTGICINGSVSCVVNEDYALTKKGDFTKWFEIASKVASIKTYYTPYDKTKNTSFSKSEVQKLKKYDLISDIILDHIKATLPNFTQAVCLIEGYSYNSQVGNLIDLVTYSTLLRQKLLKNGMTLKIVPPAELKLLAAKFTYPSIDVGKKKPKLEWRNHDGIAAGKFNKHDMYKAICDNQNLSDNWYKLLKEHFIEQISSKSISKPFDDINDSYLLYHSFNSN